MRRFAFRHLSVTPSVYWRLTPAELAEMLEGALERERERWDRTAWLAARLMNVSGKSVKKPVTAAELLGRDNAKRQHAVHGAFPGEEKEAQVKELLRRQRALEEGGED